ncbi:MAG: hypothetical protein P8R54_04500 [Myxococcota bacterium]|nr:hypothetical protein [Myxococcota bacterium]
MPPANKLPVSALKTRNMVRVNHGLKAAQECSDVASFDALLKGVTYSHGKLNPNKAFSDRPGQRWHDHALRGLIAFAPPGSLGASLRTQIDRLTISGKGRSGHDHFQVPVDLAPLARFPNLRSLTLENAETVTGLGSLTQLETLEVRGASLPQGHAALKLKSLTLNYMSTPPRLTQLTKTLQSLYLGSMQQLELSGLEDLTALRSLSITSCRGLTALPGVEVLTKLEVLDLRYCESLSTLPDLSTLTALHTLNLNRCAALKSIEGLAGLRQLKTVTLVQCKALRSIAALAGNPHLVLQDLSECAALRSLDGLEQTGSLGITWMNLAGCRKLKDVAVLARFTKLKALSLSTCGALKSIAPLRGLHALTWLRLDGCTALTSVAALQGHSALQKLRMTGCSSLTNLEGLSGLTGFARTLSDREACNASASTSTYNDNKDVGVLDLSSLKGLTTLKGLEPISGAERINLSGASSLKNLDALAAFSTLKTLDLSNCRSLTSLQPLVDLKQLSSLSLSGCSALRPRPKRVRLDTPAKISVEVLRHRPKTKSKAKTTRSSTTTKALRAVRTLLHSRDYKTIQQGVALAQGTADGALFDALLDGVRVSGMGEEPQHLLPNKTFSGTGPAQPWLDHALQCLVASAPPESAVGVGLQGEIARLVLGASKPGEEHVRAGIPDLGCAANFPNLTHLTIRNAHALKSLVGLTALPALKTLIIEHCEQLESLSALGALGAPLEEVVIRSCSALSSLAGLEVGAQTLTRLTVTQCGAISTLAELAPMTTLKYLDLSGCQQLRALRGLSPESPLETLDLNGCHTLQSLEPLGSLHTLRLLGIKGARSQNYDGFTTLVAHLHANNGVLLPWFDVGASLRPRSHALAGLIGSRPVLVLK